MNILFISIGDASTLRMDEHGVYTDLVRELKRQGNDVYVVCSRERKYRKETSYGIEAGVYVLRVKTSNITKINILQKGLTIIAIEQVFRRAIHKYLKDVRFDFVLYSTPPITLTGIISWVKKRYGAKSYLMLKDIFPQNAIDLGIMNTIGLTAPVYWYFKRKEKQLYALSDNIGCMSPANVEYIIEHNPELDPKKVELCPNTMDIIDSSISESERKAIRKKYGLPFDKTVFVYGGNLGKPQGIPFIIECLKNQERNTQVYFLIVGDGTEYVKLEAYFYKSKPKNMKLMKQIPKSDYDRMIASCDIGMIFLDHRFTIPNFPSRLLSYMQAGLPVVAATDITTDIGKVIVDNGFGWWCESNDVDKFTEMVQFAVEEIAVSEKLEQMRSNEKNYLLEHYSTSKAYKTIIKEK